MTIFQKSVAASIVLGLAVLQLVAISVARRWIGRPSRELRGRATLWHRYEGFVAFTLIVAVAYYCTQLWPGSETPRVYIHALLGVTVISLILAKMLIARVYKKYYSRLPYLGVTLFFAIIALWVSSAGWYFVTSGGY